MFDFIGEQAKRSIKIDKKALDQTKKALEKSLSYAPNKNFSDGKERDQSTPVVGGTTFLFNEPVLDKKTGRIVAYKQVTRKVALNICRVCGMPFLFHHHH